MKHIVFFLLILLSVPVSANIDRLERGWVETERSEIGNFVDVRFTEIEEGYWEVIVKLEPELKTDLLLASKRRAKQQEAAYQMIYAKHQARLKQRRNGIALDDSKRVTGNLRQVNAYPIRGITRKYIDEVEEDFEDKEGLGVRPSVKHVDMMGSRSVFRVRVDTDSGEEQLLKIGFGTITYSYSGKTITVLGDAACGDTEANPCDFDSVYNADKAGKLQLYSGSAGLNRVPNPQVRPADKLALKIKINLTGCGNGAGDTVDITGTDKDGGAQTESIDVAAGDGSYQTAKWWKTITDVDCTGFSGGALLIYQEQWGSMWRINGMTYFLNDKLYLGDGHVPTWFIDTNIIAIWWDKNWPDLNSMHAVRQLYIKKNATFRLGELANAGTTATEKGGVLRWGKTSYNGARIARNDGRLELYGSMNTMYWMSGHWKRGASGTSELMHVLNTKGQLVGQKYGNTVAMSMCAERLTNPMGVSNRIVTSTYLSWDGRTTYVAPTLKNYLCGIGSSNQDFNFYDPNKKGVRTYFVLNPTFMKPLDSLVVRYKRASYNYQMLRVKWEVLLQVVNASDIPLAGASVTVADAFGATMINGVTNAEGYMGQNSSAMGNVSGIGTENLTDSSKGWSTDQWKYHDVLITNGSAKGERQVILGNTNNMLQVLGWVAEPKASDNYVIVPIVNWRGWTPTHHESSSYRTTNTITNYNPHYITITAPGHREHTQNVSFLGKTEWVIKLTPIQEAGGEKMLVIGLVLMAFFLIYLRLNVTDETGILSGLLEVSALGIFIGSLVVAREQAILDGFTKAPDVITGFVVIATAILIVYFIVIVWRWIKIALTTMGRMGE